MTFDRFSTAEMVASKLASEISEKVVIVTGCTVGSLGTEVAKAIASSGARIVVVSGRSESKLKDSIDEIRKSQTSNCEIRSLIMDLSSLKSVRSAAQQILAYTEAIDVLINNAGIMAHPLFRTEDGFEGQVGINHLGPFLFTDLLLISRTQTLVSLMFLRMDISRPISTGLIQTTSIRTTINGKHTVKPKRPTSSLQKNYPTEGLRHFHFILVPYRQIYLVISTCRLNLTMASLTPMVNL